MQDREVSDSAQTPVFSDVQYSRKKTRRKRVRVFFEFLVIGFLVFLLVRAFFTLVPYRPYDAAEAVGTEQGFIALSYFGIDRTGETNTTIGVEQIRQHLAALKARGYVTITQQDILDYYRDGKPLPQHALFLMFEDGRRDTAILGKEVMAELNYKATMMTYPEKFGRADPKFLEPKDLKALESESFWEMGTNGYRLEFINVFDRYDNYLGEVDPLRFDLIRPYIGRRYNHYLMDYARDADGVPKESERHMRLRIASDYMLLRDIYMRELGYIPAAHVLMHANTGRFGNNPDVSRVNEKWIRELFPMNFNREGYSVNTLASSRYDLTRIQPQPYWSVNHLLMRIKYDTNDDSMAFEPGEEDARRAAWDVKEGALEMKEKSLILTTLPEGNASARLAGSEDFGNIHFEARLNGNAFGEQAVNLRSSADGKTALRVLLVNSELVVQERIGGEAQELYRARIDDILGEKPISVEEDARAARVRENEAFARYAPSVDVAQEHILRASEIGNEPAASVEDGAERYLPVANSHARASHDLVIHLRDDRISVELDGVEAVKALPLSVMGKGAVVLESSWKGESWSQRNLADDVYDGVFDQVRIKQNTGSDMKGEPLLYTSDYMGWENVKYKAKKYFETMLHWFLRESRKGVQSVNDGLRLAR